MLENTFKRKVVDKTLIIKEHTTYQRNLKYSTKEKIERIIYRALVLECGHTIKMTSEHNEKMKSTTCYSCMRKGLDREGNEPIKQEAVEETNA